MKRKTHKWTPANDALIMDRLSEPSKKSQYAICKELGRVFDCTPHAVRFRHRKLQEQAMLKEINFISAEQHERVKIYKAENASLRTELLEMDKDKERRAKAKFKKCKFIFGMLGLYRKN